MNTHKIEFFSGGSTLLTEGQANAIKEQLKKGAEFINVGNDLVNVKSISRIGTHHATSQIKKIDKNMLDISLIEAGRGDLVDRKRKLIKEKTVKQAIEREKYFMEKVRLGDHEALKAYMELPEPPKQVETGEDGTGCYYIHAGEKIYS